MKKPILTFLCALGVTVSAFAQETPREIVIHDNIVSPSKTEAYRAAVRKLKDHCTQNKVNMAWNTIVMEDNTYVHLLPIEGTASFDMDHFAELKTKIGVDAFDSLIAELQDCIESQSEKLSVTLPDHSYGQSMPDERYHMVLRVIPLEGKAQALEGLFLEWQKLYASNGAKENFRIQRVRSADEQSYSIILTAKDPADMARKRNESIKLFGDKADELWKKQLALTKKYFWRRGWMVPELSYDYKDADAARAKVER